MPIIAWMIVNDANHFIGVNPVGNDELKVIAAELVTSVRRSATIDWTVRDILTNRLIHRDLPVVKLT